MFNTLFYSFVLPWGRPSNHVRQLSTVLPSGVEFTTPPVSFCHVAYVDRVVPIWRHVVRMGTIHVAFLTPLAARPVDPGSGTVARRPTATTPSRTRRPPP